MNAAQISSAKTSELVAFYNSLAAKPVTKFADRATAEKRVAALIEDAASVFAFSAHGKIHCPGCGTHLSNGIGQHGEDVNGKIVKHDSHEFACLGCGHEFGAPIRKVASSASRSAAIAQSWTNPEVAAKRAERTAVVVKVAGEKAPRSFTSTAQAFRKLGLDLAGHIKFRMNLKAAGALAYNDKYQFAVAAE